ncbi:hypothetical protein [Pragia fontium]|uniref:hypothetical protein n=1 Tax=Pragia fontium TaxID=82985 RepID=UPI00064B2371|nr:hypothetical protein [Pragia fontium]AKJ42677.1 hypothetical protein QQ39_11780 [Pragia fontium]
MKRTLMLATLGVAIVSASGCANLQKKKAPQAVAASEQSAYSQRFQGCMTRLEALKKLDWNSYNENKMVMDADMQTATKYLSMRATLSPDMVNVMDSVYQAKLARSCQLIDNQIFTLLLQQADRK